MTAARQARLFAPWAPGDGGGAGIGLVLARTLAGAMGGTIAVASAPGAGSTFTLRVPDGRPPRPASFNPDPADADTRQEAPPADAGTRALPQAVP
jgi:K+-sensing histidine kinase KdpD